MAGRTRDSVIIRQSFVVKQIVAERDQAGVLLGDRRQRGERRRTLGLTFCHTLRPDPGRRPRERQGRVIYTAAEQHRAQDARDPDEPADEDGTSMHGRTPGRAHEASPGEGSAEGATEGRWNRRTVPVPAVPSISMWPPSF